MHIFHPYLNGYVPPTAKRRARQCYTKILTRETNKHYPNYFSLTQEAKRSLATRLGIKPDNLRKRMVRKWEKEKALEKPNNQLRIPYKQELGIHLAGIYVYYKPWIMGIFRVYID